MATSALDRGNGPSTTNADATISFELFSSLPTELRNMIWSHALPAPRIIMLDQKICCSEENETVDTSIYSNKSHDQMILTLLHTCLAARTLALGRYELAFGLFLGGESMFIDWERDLLYLADRAAMMALWGNLPAKWRIVPKEPEDLLAAVIYWQRKVRHLAIGDVFGHLSLLRKSHLGMLKTLVLEVGPAFKDRFRDYLEGHYGISLEPGGDIDTKKENLEKVLGSIWKSNLGTSNSMPKISFLGDEELASRYRVGNLWPPATASPSSI